jgi:hypothetical protein
MIVGSQAVAINSMSTASSGGTISIGETIAITAIAIILCAAVFVITECMVRNEWPKWFFK